MDRIGGFSTTQVSVMRLPAETFDRQISPKNIVPVDAQEYGKTVESIQETVAESSDIAGGEVVSERRRSVDGQGSQEHRGTRYCLLEGAALEGRGMGSHRNEPRQGRQTGQARCRGQNPRDDGRGGRETVGRHGQARRG